MMGQVTLEQAIVEEVRRLDAAKQQEVLDYLRSLNSVNEGSRGYSARQLLQLPPEERQRLIQAAFDAAENEDFEIFEAYSEENLDASY